MPKSFNEVLEYWFGRFAKMRVGEAVEISEVGKRDPELFLDVCKTFIDNGNYDFEFSNDYKFLIRKWDDQINNDQTQQINRVGNLKKQTI